jgi:hypothetical protein
MAHTEIYASPPNSTTSGLAPERIESGREQNAEKRARDSSSGAPSPAERRVLRSPGMWGLLYLPALTAIALLAYMALNLYPGPGRMFGAGDHGSPNAQPGDK